MPRFVPVASVAQIPPGRAEAFVVGPYEIAVFNVDGTFYAIENACPHQGGPLSEGFIDGPVVTCPWHAWCFNVADGRMTLGGYTSVETFEVVLEGDTISVATEPRC